MEAPGDEQEASDRGPDLAHGHAPLCLSSGRSIPISIPPLRCVSELNVSVATIIDSSSMPLDELVPAIHQRVRGGPRREQIEIREISRSPARPLEQEQVLDAKRPELEIGDPSEHRRRRDVPDEDLLPHVLADGHVETKAHAAACPELLLR
jgi:hypothetical protein